MQQANEHPRSVANEIAHRKAVTRERQLAAEC